MCAVLFPGRSVRVSIFAQPDWTRVHAELARVGVTLKLLHQEHVDVAKSQILPRARKTNEREQPFRTNGASDDFIEHEAVPENSFRR